MLTWGLLARADFFQNDVARHFEQKIAPEEGAGRHAVSGGVETEILVHGQRGEADVYPIEIAQEINKDRQRQEPPIDLARMVDRSTFIVISSSKALAAILVLIQHRFIATACNGR